jgi:hypothetical protein
LGSGRLLDFLVSTATEDLPSQEQQHAEQAVVRVAAQQQHGTRHMPQHTTSCCDCMTLQESTCLAQHSVDGAITACSMLDAQPVLWTLMQQQ